MARFGILLCALGLLIQPSAAETYVVDADGTGEYATIQAALDAVSDGDTILLLDGTYLGAGNQNLDCHGKAVTIRSQSGSAAACVIDCEASAAAPARGFHFNSGEDPGTLIADVTIANGYVPGEAAWQDGAGGGVYITQAAPTFSGCIFTGHQALFGGAIHIGPGGHAEISGCTFASNEASLEGGGIACWIDGTATLTDCVFSENGAQFRGGGIAANDDTELEISGATFFANSAQYGGGLYACGFSAVRLAGSTFAANAGVLGGGLHCSCYASAELENCIIAFGSEGAAIACVLEGAATLACCDLFGNPGGDWVGCVADQAELQENFSADPLFCDITTGDLHLDLGSPCAPNQNPVCGQVGAWPVGCDDLPARPTTWGGLKSRFRSGR
jgi:predicted outer membrane repeat protein